MTGKQLRRLRKQIGLSVAKAAKQVEVSHRTWARWETKSQVPAGPVKLFKLINADILAKLR